MHCNKELSMGAFVPTLILCALPMTLGGGTDDAQTVHQLTVTVLSTHNTDAGSHIQIAPPTESGGGTSETYCQSTPNSQGHVAMIGAAGSLDLEQGTFALTVSGQVVHPG